MNKNILAGLLAVLVLCEGAGVIYFVNKSQGLEKNLQETKVKLEATKPDYDKMAKEAETAKNQYDALIKEHEAVKADRLNLLSQVKTLLGERNRAEELTVSLDKSGSELGSLKKQYQDIQNDNAGLNEEIKKLQDLQTQITKERDNFKLAYEKARKDTEIKELKSKISGIDKEKGALEANLKKAQKTTQELSGDKSKLEIKIEELTKELKEYKKNYAEAGKKNKNLQEEAKNIPKKFSEIARQNKMLLKETAKMHYNLGTFYTKNKEYERAIAEFEKVSEIDPDDSYAHFNLGYIYAEYMVNRKKAIEHFRHFLRLAKSDDKDIDWVRKYLLTWETYEGKVPME